MCSGSRSRTPSGGAGTPCTSLPSVLEGSRSEVSLYSYQQRVLIKICYYCAEDLWSAQFALKECCIH